MEHSPCRYHREGRPVVHFLLLIALLLSAFVLWLTVLYTGLASIHTDDMAYFQTVVKRLGNDNILTLQIHKEMLETMLSWLDHDKTDKEGEEKLRLAIIKILEHK